MPALHRADALVAIDVLALDHRAPFPLSLVLSRKALLRYQLLFRFLLHLRHVEGALGAMWIEHKAGPWRASLPGEFSSGSRPGSRPRTPGADGGGGGGGGGTPKGGPGSAADLGMWRLRVCVLRARMLAFVQHVGAFAALDVLGPAGRALDARLTRVRTVDELLALHVAFLDGSLKGCMLTHDKLLRVRLRWPQVEPDRVLTRGAGAQQDYADVRDVCRVRSELYEECRAGVRGRHRWWRSRPRDAEALVVPRPLREELQPLVRPCHGRVCVILTGVRAGSRTT
jgi:hypothetical protein